MEYYKQKKVLSHIINADGTCEGVVAGSGDGDYHVHVDMEHPRKSTCDCPLAKGKKIICKHIVAVSLCIDDYISNLRGSITRDCLKGLGATPNKRHWCLSGQGHCLQVCEWKVLLYLTFSFPQAVYR